MKIIRPISISQTSEFSRASTATYFDADGVLQTAEVDEPRFTFDPETGESLGVLIEDEATNLLAYSEQFDDAGWVKTRASISANRTTSPDGQSTADKLIEDISNGTHVVRQSIAGVEAIYTFSCFVKAAERTWVSIQLSNNSTAAATCWFNLDAGAAGVVSSGVGDFTDGYASIQSIGDGWYRCSISATKSTSVSTTVATYIGLHNGSAASYVGDGVSGLYVWGALLEEGPAPTSYIKTEASSVTRAADIIGEMLTSNVPEDDYPEYDSGDTYALADSVISTTTHRIYESLQADNTGNPLPVSPEISTAWWLDKGATNRWKMFDNSTTSQTTNPDYLAVGIKTTSRVDSVGLLNVNARTARIIMTDDTAGEVYNEIYSLVSNSGITDYYEYFFEPVERAKNFTISDMPLYSGALVQVILEDEGGTVACGACIIGLSLEIGDSQYGATLGIEDFSVKSTDEFGNTTILERAYSDTQELQVFVENTSIDRLKRTLAQFRATPVLWIGSEAFEAMIIYGFYRSFGIVISYPTHSILNLEVEGLA